MSGRVKRANRPRRGALLILCLAATALLSAACADLSVPAVVPGVNNDDDVPEGGLIWSDEFNDPAGTAADVTYWRHDVGGTGWGNGELQCYTESTANSATDGQGNMVITTRYQPGTQCQRGGVNDWTSAKLITAGKLSRQYGLIEMRAKVPSGVGSWPAFWMLGANRAQVGWPASGEIDIAEMLGRDPRKVMGTLHGPPDPDSDVAIPQRADGGRLQYQIGDKIFGDDDLSKDFHTYAINWQPDKIVWLFDNQPYATATRKMAAAKGGEWVFNQPFTLIINTAVGGKFGGPPADSMRTQPQRFLIDYVRIYK